MNIILSNSSVNNGNRGCVALSLSIMYLIDKLLNKSNIPHVFYLPDSGFRLTENHTFHCGGVELKYKSCQNISFYNKRNALENMRSVLVNIFPAVKYIRTLILFWI